jgi:eukaryotic-like serine/threonine-protein kinase
LSLVGQIIEDRYRLMEVVGRGGHGFVHRALERSTGREVAIKILRDDVAGSAELETRLEREYAALVELEGTAAPAAYGLHRHNGARCLSMELLRGQDLDDYLRDIEAQGYRMEVPTLVEFMEPVVATLERAHQRGIVHRDLKPGNVFVLGRGGPGGVRLLDFGLAWSDASAPITRDGIVIGSPSYIAPEVWAGNPRALDRRTDVYSLGAIVFRALAGSVPFPVASLQEKLVAATTAPRPSLHAQRPDLPIQVDDWVRRALAIDPAGRFPGVREMWNGLLDVLAR